MNISMHKNRGGYALLLMLLFVVIVGCFLYVGNPALLFQKETQKDPSGDLLPWKEKDRLAAKGRPVQMPSPSQPPLAGMIGYKSYPKENDEDRGEISLLIDTDGRVKGNWSGDFREGADISYAVLAGAFDGNIDPSKVFRDKSDQDPSKLYFIAKGSFILLGENRKNNDSFQRRGEIYVTGWIAGDYTVIGKITLTSDRKNFRVFTWDGYRSNKNALSIF
jgi:hypothetical protein